MRGVMLAPQQDVIIICQTLLEELVLFLINAGPTCSILSLQIYTSLTSSFKFNLSSANPEIAFAMVSKEKEVVLDMFECA